MIKKSFCVAVLALGMAMPALATPSEEVILMTSIEPTTGPGARLNLTAVDSARCRYFGELIQGAVDRSRIENRLLETQGADAAQWHISVTQRYCKDGEAKVSYRIDLPKSPSLAGGGGIPPKPAGYPAGTRFVMVPESK